MVGSGGGGCTAGAATWLATNNSRALTGVTQYCPLTVNQCQQLCIVVDCLAIDYDLSAASAFRCYLYFSPGYLSLNLVPAPNYVHYQLELGAGCGALPTNYRPIFVLQL